MLTVGAVIVALVKAKGDVKSKDPDNQTPSHLRILRRHQRHR
jgi:hypothetical protein